MQQHADGQVYVTENGEQRLHAVIHGQDDVEIQIGGHAGRVQIDKFYGPLIFWPIRVTLDMAGCEWVVERECGPVGEWREVTRIPGQLDSDFNDPDRDVD